MFWLRSTFLVCFMYVVQVACGYNVVRGNLAVGYSRKLEHMLIHTMPVLMTTAMPSYTVTDETERETIKDKMSINDLLWMQWIMVVVLGTLIKPLRRGMTMLMLSHRSIDRPEDRPYTLSWILSQTIGIQVKPIAPSHARSPPPSLAPPLTRSLTRSPSRCSCAGCSSGCSARTTRWRSCSSR